MRPYRYDLGQGFFSKRFFAWLFARVEISPRHLRKWRRLVAKGVVIPLLDSPSRLDFLALFHLYRTLGGNFPKFPVGISLLPWVSFKGWYVHVRAWILWLFRRICLFDPFYPEKNEELDRLGRVPFVLFLHPAGAYLQRCVRLRMTPLEAVIRYQRSLETPLFLVPHLIVYDVVPPTEKKSLYTALWGEVASPRWTLRLKSLLRRKRISVQIGAPIDLQRFIKQYPSLGDDELARKVRRAAETILDKKLRGITGPPLPSRERMVTKILEDPGLWKRLEELSGETGKTVEELASKAKRYAFEIASDLRPSYVKRWEGVLRWVWQTLYDGVDINREIEQKLRRIARNYPLVYIPSHKSHVDYFLLSYVLYEMNLPLPLIAAGINLSFWPIGPIFRRSGAFFIRRSFRDNPLYGEVFYLYLRELVREGVPIEFFIEGGRSRTGKLILPKKGMLSMIFRAYFEKVAKDVYIVPTAISYERIVEEEGYVRELRGDEKRKERTRDLLRVRKIFRKRYGTVYVRFGTPLSLARYLDGMGGVPESAVPRRDLYQKAADDIIRAIQKAMRVTPSSLVAAALLSQRERSMKSSVIKETTALYLSLLERGGVDCPSREEMASSFSRVIHLFRQDGVLREGKEVDPDDPHYYIPPSKRIHLEFSKNMMVMHVAPLSLYAWAVSWGREDPSRSPFKIFSLLFHLFEYEFLLPVGPLMGVYRRSQTLMKDLTAKELSKVRGVIMSSLEGYYAGATYVLRKEWKGEGVEEKRLVQEMIQWGKELLDTTQIRLPESVTSAVFQGWIRMATEMDIFEAVVPSHDPRKRKIIKKGKGFDKVRDVVEILDRLLFLPS